MQDQDWGSLHLPLLCSGRGRHLFVSLGHSVRCHLHVRPPPKSLQRSETYADQHYSCSSFLIIFIEIPLLLRICPTSQKFDTFVRRFETNYMRAAIYAIMSVIQWLSLIAKPHGSALIAAAVFLLIAAVFYALAGVKGQGFVGSKTLGGQGVAQMIV